MPRSILQGRYLRIQSSEYYEKVLGYGPIAYWPQWERTGAAATCQVNSAQNGAYVGVTLGQVGIGDGNVCPFYDGANDLANIYSGTLAGRFNGPEGTAMIWARVANAGVWTDGAFRYSFNLWVDVNNHVNIQKMNVNNTIRFRYMAGGVADDVTVGGLTRTDWMVLLVSWSASAGITGEVRAYIDGIQQGITQVGLGVWAGNLGNTTTCIGAANTIPTFVWHGYLAHCAVWDRALSPAQIAGLAVV